MKVLLNFFKSFFSIWNFYSIVYDGLLKLKPYQQLIEDVVKQLDPHPGQKILNAGCGTGNLEKVLAGKGLKITAIDFSPKMLEVAKKKLLENNNEIDFKEINLNQKLPFPDNEFDKVVCVNTIYNVENPGKTLNELWRVLKPEGILILATPKTGSDPMLILKAHRHNHEPEKKWQTTNFWMWLWFVLRAFGLTGTAVKFVAIAVVNKKLFKIMKGFEKDELESLLIQSNFKILASGFTYANQNLIIKAQKEVLKNNGVLGKA